MTAADARRNPGKRRRDMLKATKKWQQGHPGFRYGVAHMITEARGKGRRKLLEFSISGADVEQSEFCPVLGTRLDYKGTGRRTGQSWDSIPSLDRVDNSKGYVPGNVVVISWLANHLKGAATGDQLRALAAYSTEHGV